MKLTIATWNMDHWKRTPAQREAAWQRLQNSDYDIALLQETIPPADVRRQDVVWREIGRERRFGSAVVSLKGWPIEEISTAKSCRSYLAFPLLGTFPGSVAIARVHPPGFRPVTLVSLYTVIDIYSITTLCRQIADLVPLFDSVHAERLVLGGDLNASTQRIDDDFLRYEAAFGLIESFGLVDLFRRVKDRPTPIGSNCECKRADCYHVGTHRNAGRSNKPGLHLDYLFASEALAARCNRLRLDDDAALWELSDHCPVIAEIELEEATGPAPWPDRYASDVGDLLRAVLTEPRDWGIWKPGLSRPVVKTDRSLTKWIYALWEGELKDSRLAQVELGIWRAPGQTKQALVAHAGFHGKPMTAKLDGIEIVAPAGSRAKIAEMPNHARYLIVPCETNGLPEQEIRAALDALLPSLRK